MFYDSSFGEFEHFQGKGIERKGRHLLHKRGAL
jgi:hypothetical protein